MPRFDILRVNQLYQEKNARRTHEKPGPNKRNGYGRKFAGGKSLISTKLKIPVDSLTLKRIKNGLKTEYLAQHF